MFCLNNKNQPYTGRPPHLPNPVCQNQRKISKHPQSNPRKGLLRITRPHIQRRSRPPRISAPAHVRAAGPAPHDAPDQPRPPGGRLPGDGVAAGGDDGAAGAPGEGERVADGGGGGVGIGGVEFRGGRVSRGGGAAAEARDEGGGCEEEEEGQEGEEGGGA